MMIGGETGFAAGTARLRAHMSEREIRSTGFSPKSVRSPGP